MWFWNWLRSFFNYRPVKDPDPVVSPTIPDGELKWMGIAKSQIGVREAVPGNNPKIIEYHSHTTLKATLDSVAWCSAFVCWCLDKAGIKSNKNAWAQSYASFGSRLSKPKYGCIVVFRWSASSGHVGFFASWNEDGTMKILSGNQDDMVCYKNYGTESVLAYRWPQ